MTIVEVKCPYCSASFEVPETVATTTCPYCGLTFRLGIEGKALETVPEADHFYFPLCQTDPMEVLMAFLIRQVGVPKDLSQGSVLKKRELHYVPVYFFHIEGRALAESRGGRTTMAEELDNIGIVASEPFTGLLKGYRFPMRGKRYFEERIQSQGIYHKPSFDADIGKKLADQRLREALRKEALESCNNALRFEVEESKVEYRGLVHYPIWSLSYEYRGEVYEGFVDGADGKVILVEHPVSLEARILQITTATAILLTGFVMGIALWTYTPLAILGTLIPGIASSVVLLTRSVKRRVKASETRAMEDEKESIGVEKAMEVLAGLQKPRTPIPDF
ncbi:TFIIB-type zinc ribbon-containing protein [Candidatus Bathyarchaeota archaeon]|nr:TFIIB-type zinc ribbon-containing protein [Candidatus Bathyarchaeota archaeon]